MVLQVSQTIEHVLGPGGAGDHGLDSCLRHVDRVAELLHTLRGAHVPLTAALLGVGQVGCLAQGSTPLPLHVSHHLHTSRGQAGLAGLGKGEVSEKT